MSPKRLAKAICCSGVIFWWWKNTTRCSSQAALISSKVSSSRLPRSAPSISAPSAPAIGFTSMCRYEPLVFPRKGATASCCNALIVPHFLRHWQAGKRRGGRRPVGRDAEEAEHHHELAHVLAGMPGRTLEIIVQGHVAVIDARLAGEVGGASRAGTPRLEPPQHVGAIGEDRGLAVAARRRHAGIGALLERQAVDLVLEERVGDVEDVIGELTVAARAIGQQGGARRVRDLRAQQLRP